jgi:hypothetical protein
LVLNATFNNISAISWWPVLGRKSGYLERTIDHGQATSKLLTLAAASRVHPFCNLQSRARIGDRLVWVVISNDLTYWATRTPAVMYNTSPFQYIPRFYLDWCSQLLLLFFYSFLLLFGSPVILPLSLDDCHGRWFSLGTQTSSLKLVTMI